jgi:DNA modification methylase
VGTDDELMVSEKRRYLVLTTDEAKAVADVELGAWGILGRVDYGLPEVDDRYHIWRVPLVRPGTSEKVGEVVIDARSALVQRRRGSDPAVVKARLAGRSNGSAERSESPPPETTGRPPMRNAILLGDSEETLADLPAGAVDLVFTSPPYFNARPDYTDYIGYEEYLLKIRKIIRHAHRLLGEGRFFVMNVAPVLVRRASRSQASRRIAVPFDMHRLFVEEGFDFIDDIIWAKPEGAGWATGRGRRFAADRNPLQYKTVPVTEYVLVYRKHTDKLLDWNIRHHPDQDAVRRSRIEDGYERTNVWQITPASSQLHPAVFPVELAERVIRYYSFEGDIVLDPFAGIGTVGEAAATLHRRFALAEQNPEYVEVMRQSAVRWLGLEARDVLCVNCPPIDAVTTSPRLLATSPAVASMSSPRKGGGPTC